MNRYPASRCDQPRCWTDQEFIQLSRTLIVSPVAYPDQLQVFVRRQRPEPLYISCFVKRPRPLDPKTIGIDLANCFPEREDYVKQVEPKPQDLSRIRVCTMMSVVK